MIRDSGFCFRIGVTAALLAVAVAPAWAQWRNLAQVADKSTAAKATAEQPKPGGEKLRISWLDKQTNRRDIVVLTLGTPVAMGGLVVKATKCLPDYGARLGQDVAWLDVNEGADGSGRTAPWFSGWMFNTFPEIATLDHPRYDMQLLGCGEKERKVVSSGRIAPVLAPRAPVVDAEAPDETPLPPDDGRDPFFVPGMEKPAAEEPAAAAPVNEAPAEVITPANGNAAAVVGPREATPPVEQQPAKAEQQQELHNLMDGGVY